MVQLLVNVNLILQHRILFRVETVLRDNFDSSLGTSLLVDAETDTSISALAYYLPNPINIPHERKVFHDKIDRLNDNILDFGDSVFVDNLFRLVVKVDLLILRFRLLVFLSHGLFHLICNVVLILGMITKIIDGRSPFMHQRVGNHIISNARMVSEVDVWHWRTAEVYLPSWDVRLAHSLILHTLKY